MSSVEARFALYQVERIAVEKRNPVVGGTEDSPALEEAAINEMVRNLTRFRLVDTPGAPKSRRALLGLRALKCGNVLAKLGILGVEGLLEAHFRHLPESVLE